VLGAGTTRFLATSTVLDTSAIETEAEHPAKSKTPIPVKVMLFLVII
jgi:hypothetical protein